MKSRRVSNLGPPGPTNEQRLPFLIESHKKTEWGKALAEKRKLTFTAAFGDFFRLPGKPRGVMSGVCTQQGFC